MTMLRVKDAVVVLGLGETILTAGRGAPPMTRRGGWKPGAN